MDIPKTEQELVRFHSYLRDKGLMNESTAYARSQAAQQVLSVLDPHEKSDLAAIDREMTFRRFANKNGQRFTPESLDTYRHRFNAALNEFLAYAQDPAAYRPSGRQRERPAGAGAQSPRARLNTSGNEKQRDTSDLLEYPLPLPSGAVARLLVPPKISAADAQRITALVSAMVSALTEAP